jgi:putative acetyltransferase
VIRAYGPGDRDAVLGVWQASASAAYSFWNPERFERERETIAGTYLAAAETYVFERGGAVVGFISMLGHEVGGLFVAPEAQGDGIGRALLDHVRSSREYLELDVFDANQPARAFYVAYGFEEIGSRTDEAGLKVLRLRKPAC